VRSFQQDTVDPRTRELGADIVGLAEQRQHEKGAPWYSFEKGHEALMAAVISWLESLKMRDPGSPAGSAASDIFWGVDDPQTIGRSVARHYRDFKVLAEETDRKMRNLHNKGGDK
jgi:hypothetical protein